MKSKYYLDGILTEIEDNDLEKYNVLVNKSNGYSHDYVAIEKFDRAKHFYSKRCVFTGVMRDYAPTHFTVKEVTERVNNSSTVSFS
ncbi:MAG TPA: hypothetical protein VIV55_10260 [Flavobacterium sp.]